MTEKLTSLTDEEIAAVEDPSGSQDAGFGALQTAAGCLPLKALDVRARIDGLLAQVEVRQTFVNTSTQPLEATYIFPLPDRAAVTRFRFEAAGRVIEGELRERGEARRMYDEAVSAGHRAALAEEDRAGVFTMRVGNLPPGETAVVQLSLSGPLPYQDGLATFRFPLVVAPRYIPGNPLLGPQAGSGTALDTDAVPDASRITPPVLLPGFPNPVALSLGVDFPRSALSPTEIRSSLHSMVEQSDGELLRIRLQPGERLDRDFILRFRLADASIRTELHLQPDAAGDEGTFLLTLVPPALSPAQQMPRDVAFVLDRSGSMNGWKIAAARRALGRMVDSLTDHDRFTVLAFDDQIVRPPRFEPGRLMTASNAQRFQTLEFLAQLGAGGGTEMAQPLSEAVGALAESKQNRDRQRILVLVTDGQVGNEDQILRSLSRRLKGIRVFTLGIDQAVNAAFLQRLANAGGGSCELVESEARLEEVMDAVHRRIGTPLLVGLRIEPLGLNVIPETIVPARLPDLFAGTPLLLQGRYRGTGDGGLALQARDADHQPWSMPVRGGRRDCPATAALWARGRVRELEDRYAAEPSEALSQQIVETSLRFGVLSRFTAYLAVDKSEVVNAGGTQQQVVQAVELPSGWDLDEDCCAYSMLPEFAPDNGPIRLSAPSPMSLPDLPRSFKARRSKAKSSSNAAPRGGRKKQDFWSRLLQAFAFRDAATVSEAESLKPAAVNGRLQFWQRLLRKLPHDPRMLLGEFQANLDEWQRLVAERVRAGEKTDELKRLGEVLLEIQALLADDSPEPSAVLDTRRRLEEALTAYLAATALSSRENFWK
jgi:Ca-activated chloride channel family protein